MKCFVYHGLNKNWVEVSELAARVLKDPDLLVGSGLKTLAPKVGLSYSCLNKKKGNVSVNWEAKAFSSE